MNRTGGCCSSVMVSRLEAGGVVDEHVDGAEAVNRGLHGRLGVLRAGHYADWERAARETAAILRSAVGRDPYDRDLSNLVGQLATQSKAFRTHWAAHNVRFHATATKRYHHPIVGELTLTFNRLDIAADPGMTLFTYAAEPGSRSDEALKLLGSRAATVDLEDSARATDPS